MNKSQARSGDDLPEEFFRGHAHDWAYYVLSDELAAEKKAKCLGVCESCAEAKYFKEIPAGADVIGPVVGRA